VEYCALPPKKNKKKERKKKKKGKKKKKEERKKKNELSIDFTVRLSKPATGGIDSEDVFYGGGGKRYQRSTSQVSSGELQGGVITTDVVHVLFAYLRRHHRHHRHHENLGDERLVALWFQVFLVTRVETIECDDECQGGI